MWGFCISRESNTGPIDVIEKNSLATEDVRIYSSHVWDSGDAYRWILPLNHWCFVLFVEAILLILIYGCVCSGEVEIFLKRRGEPIGGEGEVGRMGIYRLFYWGGMVGDDEK